MGSILAQNSRDNGSLNVDEVCKKIKFRFISISFIYIIVFCKESAKNYVPECHHGNNSTRQSEVQPVSVLQLSK
jgi:hypothetical protein